MNYYLLALLFLFAMLSPKESMAQNVTYNDDDKQKFTLQVVDNNDGERPVHVTRMIQDKQGFMWFSSWNGLYRYDGYEFVPFKMKAGNGIDISSDRVRKLVQAKDAEGKDANALLCLIDDQYFRFNLDTYTFEPASATELAIQKQQDSKPHKSIVEYTVLCNGMAAPDIAFEYKDSQGITWLKGEENIYKVVPTPNIYRMLPEVNGSVRAVYNIPNTGIVIATKEDKSLAFYSPSMVFMGYLGTDGTLHKERSAFASVYSVLSDSKSTVWLGAKPDGLFRLRLTMAMALYGSAPRFSVEHIATNGVLPCTDIYDIKEDKQGRLWLATMGGGIAMIANPQASPSEMKIVNVSKIAKGYDSTTDKVRRLLIMPDGMLIATTTTGILVLDNIYKNINEISCHHHAREGKRASSLSCSATMDMVDMGDGRMMFSTESGGLNIARTADLRNKECDFVHISTANGLLSDVVKSMTLTNGNRVLVQQHNSIAIFDIKTNEIRSFSTPFFGTQLLFSEARPYIKQNIGATWLFLPIETGVAMINAQDLYNKVAPPRLLLTQMTINGQETVYNLATTDTLRLASDQRTLVLRYAAMDLRDSRNISYVTRLDDAKWSLPSHVHEVSLHDLSAGEHHLHLRSTNALGQWTDNERVITIIVEPTFFEAWYGQLLILLIICSVIAIIIYTLFYIRNINEHRRETLQAYLTLLAEHEQKSIEAEHVAEQEQTTENAVQPIKEVLTPRLSEEDNAFMQRLVAFIDEHMADSSIGVQDIADATATSRSSLNRKMHQIMGVTPADFLREARIKRAAELLSKTQKSTADIAYACGFSDPKYFSKLFKASVGASPKEYRTNIASKS